MIYRFDEFALDVAQSRLTRRGQEVALQPKVFEALLLLVRRAGQLVTKQELLDALWPDTIVNEEALTQVIRKLRRALDDDPDAPRFIQTVLKRGYRFLPAVTEQRQGEENPATADDVGAVSRPRPVGLWRGLLPSATLPFRRAVLWAGIGVLGIGLFASWQILKTHSPQQTPPGSFTPGSLRVQRLTYFPEREEYGDFSPDGKSFVFVSKHKGDGRFKLYLMLTAGGDPVRLTQSEAEELSPRFSPDGRWIAVTRFEAGQPPSIWRISALGGQESLLAADAMYADWSPDGAELVFIRILASGALVLIRKPLDSPGERQLCTLPAGHSFFDTVEWSPDGQQIAFMSGEAAWVVSATGGAPRRIAESAESIQSLAWMPDGKALVCDANWGGRANLWLVPLNGRAPVPLTFGSGAHRYPTVSPDGKRVLYTNEQWQRLLWIVDHDGKSPRRLETKTTYSWFSPHPGGRRIAYCDLEAGGGDWAIGVLDVETMEQRTLGIGCYPAFSPDGETLAFIRQGSAGDGLWLVDLTSGAERRLTSTRAEWVAPAWSPDGRRLVFQRTAGASSPGLTMVDVADGREVALMSGAFRSPAWSPDGKWIAASGRGDQGWGLYLVEAATGQGRRLSALRSYEATPLWASDSRSLQILVNERTEPALVTLALDGTVLPNRLRFDFTPDPTYWGIFQAQPLPGRGWVYLLQRVEADLYLLELSR
jgi:Tol biopolymer transport system component/DNA-binding winged helix-turn-helix (wHTH) protein